MSGLDSSKVDCGRLVLDDPECHYCPVAVQKNALVFRRRDGEVFKGEDSQWLHITFKGLKG